MARQSYGRGGLSRHLLHTIDIGFRLAHRGNQPRALPASLAGRSMASVDPEHRHALCLLAACFGSNTTVATAGKIRHCREWWA